MLKNEARKNEEEEGTDARQRLVTPPENENGKKNDEKTNPGDDDDKKPKESSEPNDEEHSNSSEKKEDKADKANDAAPTEEMNGSTVEIVQPADLKPKHLGFTRTLLLAMFAAMIGTGAQYGYALGVMNAPSEVMILTSVVSQNDPSLLLADQELYERNLLEALQFYIN